MYHTMACFLNFVYINKLHLTVCLGYFCVQYVFISYYESLFFTHDVIINLQIYTQSTLPSRRHKRAIQEGRGTRVRSREGLKTGQK